MGKIKELVQTAKELGQTALGLTDHGTTSGLWTFQKECRANGIKPILGSEFYYVRENDGENGHIILLAKNNKGLENIFKLQDYAYVQNFSRKPRIDWETLLLHKEGLVVSSACLGSTFAQYILNNDIDSAMEWARKFQAEFGSDFYIEIMPNEILEQVNYNQIAVRIANQLSIKVVATNDVHYVYEQDAFHHEVLLAMQTNSKMSDEKRWKFDTTDFWLKSYDEMVNTFHGIPKSEIVSALSNTAEIADKCNAEIVVGNYLPSFYDLSKGTEREILVQKTKEGLIKRGITHKQFIKEVQNEIDVIDRNGYSGYFCIVEDYVNSARKNGIIVGDGRGSGAGSKVAYLTGITTINPAKYDLLFERFMADGRQPDFDVDFSNQDAVFKDLQSKYGVDNVARVIAFGTMTPRSVTRKIMSTFDHPTSELNAISKLIPDSAKTIKEALEESAELRAYSKKYSLEFQIIERLEGTISHESQHAGGVIVYPGLSSILPIKTRADDRNKRIVGFDKYMLEELGHYKFDILGLETLPVIKRCLDSVYESTNERIDLEYIDYEDPSVYDMLCSGQVSGVFQLSNQQAKIVEQQPRNFKDLIAINALIRPGTGDWHAYMARRKGEPWNLLDRRMPYLRETEGLITYQEQFLLDAKILAGWDIAYADKNIRKNKDIRNDEGLRQKFIQGCIDNGVRDTDAKQVWSEIENAVTGGYSFNKSHSASYAVISFHTAWLKRHYPLHFYASLMSSESDQSKISELIAECKSLGIKILPPDINNSGEYFTVHNDAINYRISTIKHVGDSAVEHIKKLRPITSFQDFLDRREKKHIRQNVVINLIKAGCFDVFDTNRDALIWQTEMANRTSKQVKDGFTCERAEYSEEIKAEWEYEVLGMYLSVHPLERFGFKSLSTFSDGQPCIQGGKVYDIKVFQDKNKNNMAFIWLNTLFGNVKAIVFSSSWKNEGVRNLFQLGKTILIRGKKSGDSIIFDSGEEL